MAVNMLPWNKGLTKKDHPGLAKVAAKKAAWWGQDARVATRKKIGEASKNKTFKKGAGASGWKGGRVISKRDGYVMVHNPSHPGATKKGYVLEHRMVMEKTLGRPLIKGKEDVHHRNGKKDDNRPENLMLVTHTAHYEEHGCAKCGFNTNTH